MWNPTEYYGVLTRHNELFDLMCIIRHLFPVSISKFLLPHHVCLSTPFSFFPFKSVCMHGNGYEIEKDWQTGGGRRGWIFRNIKKGISKKMVGKKEVEQNYYQENWLFLSLFISFFIWTFFYILYNVHHCLYTGFIAKVLSYDRFPTPAIALQLFWYHISLYPFSVNNNHPHPSFPTPSLFYYLAHISCWLFSFPFFHTLFYFSLILFSITNEPHPIHCYAIVRNVLHASQQRTLIWISKMVG